MVFPTATTLLLKKHRSSQIASVPISQRLFLMCRRVSPLPGMRNQPNDQNLFLKCQRVYVLSSKNLRKHQTVELLPVPPNRSPQIKQHRALQMTKPKVRLLPAQIQPLATIQPPTTKQKQVPQLAEQLANLPASKHHRVVQMVEKLPVPPPTASLLLAIRYHQALQMSKLKVLHPPATNLPLATKHHRVLQMVSLLAVLFWDRKRRQHIQRRSPRLIRMTRNLI
mmetsp:Transcript_94047/g.146987  ORF Transcript_94047/g.146987 Transcript_94047/m.146987 type:complete len:224 (-) Transcript_94047:836-1507(-)